MKLHYWQLGKHFGIMAICLLSAVICAFLLFGGLSNSQVMRRAVAESSPSQYFTSLDKDNLDTTDIDTRLEYVEGVYQIKSVDDLRAMAYLVNNAMTDSRNGGKAYASASYALTAHLDLSMYPFWVAIGTGESPFTGNFNGQGYSIYGLTIIDQDLGYFASGLSTQTDEIETYRGLFGYVKYAGSQVIIQKLGLKDTLIKTKATYVGSLIGRAEGDASIGSGLVKVSECYNTGYVEGSNYVGGLVGCLDQYASVENSYNAPASSQLDRYCASIQNATSDVVINTEGGAVGGIAGVASDDGKNRPIVSCYNASVIDTTADVDRSTVDRGAIVGDRSNINTGLIRTKNFFLDHCLPGASILEMSANKQGATSTKVGNINSAFLTNLGFDANCTTDSDLPALKDEAEGTNSIWQQSSKTNNYLPFLLSTPQLVRLSFDARIEGGQESILSESLDCSLDDFALKSGDNYFVTFYDSVTISTTVQNASDDFFKYEFSKWMRYDYANTSYQNPTQTEAAPSLGNVSETFIFPYNDMLLVAQYTERTYDIILSPNDTSYLKSSSILIAGEEGTVAKYGDKVTLLATPNDGYKVSGWSGAGVTQDETNSQQASFVISTYIKNAFGESVNTVDIPTSLNAFVTLAPEEYSVSYLSNREDCAGAGAVLLTADDASSTIRTVNYDQTIYLVINTDKIAANYKFETWEWQAVDAGSSVENGSWQTIENSRDDTTPFVVPDLNDGQTIYFRAVFVEKTYLVSLANEDNEGNQLDTQGGQYYLCDEAGSALSGVEYVVGQPVYVKIVANNGYFFDTVGINGQEYILPSNPSDQSIGLSGVSWLSSNSIIKFESINSDITFYAVFEKLDYTVTTNLNISNFSNSTTTVTRVSSDLDLDGTDLLIEPLTIQYGDVLTFRVNLEDGFVLDSVVANNNAINNVNGLYSVTILGSTLININVSKQTFVVTTSFSYSETYDYFADSSCFVGGGEYLYGETTQVFVNVPEMFVISAWMLNGQIVNNENKFLTLANIHENQYVVVVLTIKQSTLTFGQIGDDGSDAWYSIYVDQVEYQYMPGISSIDIQYGKKIELAINDQYFSKDGRSQQYAFAYWQINGISQTTDKYLVVLVNGKDMLIEAVFRPAEVAVMTESYLYNALSNSLTKSSEAGSVTGLDTINRFGERKTISAEASTGYLFLDWRNASGDILSTEEDYTFTITAPTTIYAVFVRVHNVNITVDDTQCSISGNGIYVVGDSVTIKATAKSGYQFVHWTENGNVISTNPTLLFTMPDNDVNLVAVLEAIYVVDCDVNDSSLGSVIGNTSGKFKENVTLEAVSANNCTFVGWMVDDVIISTSSKLNLSLNGDVKIQALFKKNFDWNIIIILFGAALFIFVMVYGSIAYIKAKEAQPVNTRALIGGKDDSEIIKKSTKRIALRDEIAPVPTRRNTKQNIQPVPVRKIVVAPSDYKGKTVGRAKKASNQQSTLNTDSQE